MVRSHRSLFHSHPGWLKGAIPLGAILGVLVVGSDESLRAQQPKSPARAFNVRHGIPSATLGRWPNASPPRHLPGPFGADGASATFFVGNFYFDADGNPATRDTVHIVAGGTVFWTWSDGGHTTTSSEGLWDQPMDRSDTDFSFTFPDAGFYSFYCAFHPAMMGFIDVQPNVGVQPDPANTSTIGFIAGPYPNPTQTGVTLRFAMRREGRARVGVYDAGGRRLAVPFDGTLGPGAHIVAWGGQGVNGRPAPAGIYYLRLEVPGAKQTRRITISR